MATRTSDPTKPNATPGATASLSAMVALALACSIGSLNSYSLAPFIVPISNDLHVSVPLLGQVTTATWLLTAGVALVVGTLADQYGHRRFLLIGLVAVMISTAGCAAAPNFETLFAARLFTSISAGILEGVTFAFAGVLFSEQSRTRVFAILTAALAGSSTLGTPLLTTIASATSWREAFLLITVFGAGGGVLALHCLPGRSLLDSQAKALSLRDVVSGFKTVRLSPNIIMLLGASLLYAIPWQAFLTYMGASFSLQFGLSTRSVGWAFCLGSASYIAGSLLVGGRLRRFPPYSALALSVGSAGACLLIMMTLPSEVVIALAMTTGICFSAGIAWVILTSLLTTGPEHQYATILSLNVAISTLGAAAGGGLGGLFLSAGGWSLFGFGLSGFVLPAVVLICLAAHVSTQSRMQFNLTPHTEESL